MQSTEYVRQKNWEHRIRGNQINIRTCPKCGDAGWHFYMSRDEGGAWDCKKCQEKGNLFTLMKALGDVEEAIHPAARKKTWAKPKPEDIETNHQALFSDYEALRYLDSRGISRDSVRRFKLGLRVRNGNHWLCIPILYGGEWANIKYRSLPPAEKAFEREYGCRSVLFNGSAAARHGEVILAEGEFDAITLLQHGFENVIGTTGGAGSFDASWVDELRQCKKIYLCYDADEAGQKGARAVAKRLGYNRCWNVLLPCKDANDFFRNHTADDFRKYLDRAVQFSLPGIITSQAALDLLQGEAEAGQDRGRDRNALAECEPDHFRLAARGPDCRYRAPEDREDNLLPRHNTRPRFAGGPVAFLLLGDAPRAAHPEIDSSPIPA